jgi:hypothetical protein
MPRSGMRSGKEDPVLVNAFVEAVHAISDKMLQQ